MPDRVLSELRLLGSASFDSKIILTVVLSGDHRLPERLKSPDLIPLGSRIRTRMRMEPAGRDELVTMLKSRMEAAGNGLLMTDELIKTLADHSAGNFRVMVQTTDELLAKAVELKIPKIDEQLFFQVFALSTSAESRRKEMIEMVNDAESASDPQIRRERRNFGVWV